MRQLSILMALLVLASCGGGSSSSPEPTPPVVTTPPAPTASELLKAELEGLDLETFYEESFEALMYRSPEGIIWTALTSIYPLDDAGLDDFSDSYSRETIAMHQVVLDLLLSYDKSSLTADEQLNHDIYAWYLQDIVDSLDFIYYEFKATYNFVGVQSSTERFFTDIHPLVTEQDALDYISRLNQVDTKFEQVVEFLSLAQGAGIVEPRVTLDVAFGRTNQIATTAFADTPFYTAFVAKVDAIAALGDTRKQELKDQALNAVTRSVVPAYRSLANQLASLQSISPTTIGVGQYPSGSDYYNYALRHRTTTDLTAAEIHQLGLDELERIHAEMRVIFDQLGYPQSESLQRLFERVAADGGIIAAGNVKSTYEDIITAAQMEFDLAFDIFPSADVVVADDPFGGFYIAPSFDGTRPGAFYAGTQNNQPWFAMPSLAYHEAVPGHHTQIAISMDQDGPQFRRIVRYTAFVEGWALYAERLAYELGWYEGDPYGNLGRLQYEALRAARLVMDTGIHAMGWSFQQAVLFNMENVGASQGSSEGAAGRYSVVPSQANAYMIGMLSILQLRQQAMDELGAEFDLKEFHRVLLQAGGIPLSLLDDVVERYIADKLASP